MKEHARTHPLRFRDREEAGILLAETLYEYRNRPDVLVLGIPRSGVPVASAVAGTLNVPMALFACRKIPHPANPHRAIGSICADEVVLHDEEGIPSGVICEQVSRMRHAIQQELAAFTADEKILKGKIVILVDDRLKQKDTLSACLRSLRKKEVKKIIVAVPIATHEQVSRLQHRNIVIRTVLSLPCMEETPAYYDDFHPPGDQELLSLCRKHAPKKSSGSKTRV